MFRFVDDGWEMLAREYVMCASLFQPPLGRTAWEDSLETFVGRTDRSARDSWSGVSVGRIARESHSGGVVGCTLNSVRP